MASKKPKALRRPAARRASERPERQQDPRLVAVPVEAVGDAPRPGHWVLVVSPVNMDGGRRLMWHPPQPVAFNLLEAKRLRDRGVKARQAIMAGLERRDDGGYGPENPRRTLDCLSDLSAAVLFAFTAIESLANHAIDMLPGDATVSPRKGKDISQPDMVRDLGIDAKLKRVIPLVEGGVNIAGTTTWKRYRGLKFLRDELLHVKRRGYEPDPDVRTAYDRLIVGEGDGCVDQAEAVVSAAWPSFLPPHVLEALH